ncbi:hypothetical protein ABDX87_28535 [Pseudomonas abietaniphila]|uniref:hypothetical protein n=1 Tax=Pseudomonas abietaniphila TaxID=89065 RepID=UPI003216EF0A
MRYIFLFLLLLVSQTSFSANFYWTRGAGTVQYPSALAACPNPISYYSFTLAPDHVTIASNLTTATCVYMYDGNRNGVLVPYNGESVYRKGDSCPVNTTYNSVTGACDAPSNPCASKKDVAIPSFKWDSNSDLPPSTISSGGCEATISKGKCYYASIGKAVCNGTATFTGNQLASNPNGAQVSDCSGDACASGAPQPEKKSQDCVYSSNGSGSSSCTATTSDSTPGTAQCGSVNGAYTCIESPKASLTSNTISSTKTPTSNSNGTLTVVQNDTITTVKCSGKSCTTTTSNSSGTTVTNSSGQVISHDSTCTGKSCGSSGQVSTGGSGNGTGDQEEGDDGDSPSAGTLTDPTNGSFAGQGDDWDSKIEKAKKEYKDGIDKIKDSFKPMGDVSIGGGSKLYCPPAVTVLGKNIDFCLDKYASSLSWISDAILALCAMIALIIVFS